MFNTIKKLFRRARKTTVDTYAYEAVRLSDETHRQLASFFGTVGAMVGGVNRRDRVAESIQSMGKGFVPVVMPDTVSVSF